jgi:NlpC/P60 family putative phage cell wall peptidase
VPLNEFAAGDVLLFRWRSGLVAKHAAIVTTCGSRAAGADPGPLARMVHAHDGAVVAEVALSPWWRRRLAYAFAFPGLTD